MEVKDEKELKPEPLTSLPFDSVYSYSELQEKIKQMKEVSNKFYFNAIQIQNHPFIEFCGLMNEYIKCCEEALQNGIDFTQCNTHSSQKLPMSNLSKEYMNEKLECIFTGDFEIK